MTWNDPYGREASTYYAKMKKLSVKILQKIINFNDAIREKRITI